MPHDTPTDPTRWNDIKRVFEATLDLPADRRPGYLDTACRTPTGEPDAELRAAVESLLQVEDQLGDGAGGSGFMSEPPAGRVLSDMGANLLENAEEEPELASGARVGPYEVVRLLGRGGMGEVYLAERVDGLFSRTVALKRVRANLAPGLAERFASERQILAGLLHPGIARLYGAGSDDDGRPWLAMEPVDGEPLPTYAAALGQRARVDLVAQACDAVQHAHQRLVVHRDIKPSNVLVTPEARVVLLDFGIAQVLGAEEEQRLLTRSYAAPEQIEGEAATTASDVYSLGVLLVETLTGQRPSQPGDAGTLTGDLAAIARRALAQDPAGRYASASALGADLRLWRESRPVLARPRTFGYLARTFVARHTVGALALALLALSIVGGLVATSWQAREARHAAAESDATASFLAALFEGADPTASGDSLLALDLLQRGAERIEQYLAGQPGVRAKLYHVVGEAYLGLGQADSAIAFARRAMAARQPGGAAPEAAGAAQARVLLGRALYPSDPEAADRELATAVTEARSSGDDEALLDALEARGILAGSQVLSPAETVEVLEEAVALAERMEGENSLRRGRLYAALATKVASAHQHGRIEPLLREALARLPADEAPYDRSGVQLELANLLHATGKPEEALALANEALVTRRRLFGADDPRTAGALGTRAMINSADPLAAEADSREALRLARRAGDSALEVEVLNSLGSALEGQKRYSEAAAIYRQRMALVGEVLGTDGTRYAASSGNVARALDLAGRFDEAAVAWAESIRLTSATYGPESAVAASTLLAASHTAERQRLAARSLSLSERAFAASRGLDTSSVTRAMAGLYLGRRLLDAGRAEEALGPLREARAARAALDKGAHSQYDGPSGAEAEALLGEALVSTGRGERGIQLLQRAVPALMSEKGAEAPQTRRAQAALSVSARR